MERFRQWAFKPVDHASFSFFRIVFGILMIVELYRYYHYDWIKNYFLAPSVLFTYYGFSWVKPWPGDGLYLHWIVTAVFALFISLGFLYRLSSVLFFLGVTYIFLLNQAAYLNHWYLICLFSFLLIFVPAHRACSIDKLIGLATPSRTIPNWALWLLRFQLGVVYFYAGIAKISHDWLHAEPMRAWTIGRTDLLIIGRFANEAWLPYLLSYAGLFFDLMIVPLLLWRRTRLVALALAFCFHILNANMFHIGIFPWLSSAATLLYLSPSWPRRLARFLPRGLRSALHIDLQPPAPSSRESPASRGRQAAVLTLATSYALLQLLVPFRHYLYPGNVDWTHEGHRFSWRMLLYDRTSRARFYVIDPNIDREEAVRPEHHLRRSVAEFMAARPDMILQFAHYLARTMPRAGPLPLRVEARILSSINGRKAEEFVRPGVDLAAETRNLKRVRWVMPMKEPLPKDPRARRRVEMD